MMALRSVLAPHLGWGGAGAIKGAAARRGVTWDHNLEQHGHGGQPLESRQQQVREVGCKTCHVAVHK